MNGVAGRGLQILGRQPAYKGAQEKDATFWNEVMRGKTINQTALPSAEGKDRGYRYNGERNRTTVTKRLSKQKASYSAK